jgi:CheY-like chemotaxis protein
MSWDLSLSGLAVLVVDDHDDGRELAATILDVAGASVSTAASGREALALLGSSGSTWDVVITDISMPDGTGYDLIRDARRMGLRVPMVALTALDTPEHRRRLLHSGFALLLIKPVMPERLILAVWDVATVMGTTAGARTSDAADDRSSFDRRIG